MKKLLTLLVFALGFCLPAKAQISSRVNATSIKNAMSCADTSISANTITCSTFQGLTGYVTGQTFFVQVANTTTGATTININSLGAKNVTKNGTTAIASGDLVANGNYAMRYDGTEFVVLGNMSAGTLPSGPTSPNSVPQFLTSTPSGGVAGSPVYALSGVTPRHVSGTTSTDTIASTDNDNSIVYDGSVAVAVTLPTPTTLAVPQFVGHLVNNTSGSATAVTVTATTNTFATTGTSTLTIPQGQTCTITVQSSSVWDDECHDLPLQAGTNITITRGQFGPTASAAGGAFAGGAGTSFQDAAEIAAPANPSAGNDRLYLDSTSHLLACLTSAGASCMPSGGGISGLTTNTIPIATSATSIGNGPISYNGTNTLTATPSTGSSITLTAPSGDSVIVLSTNGDVKLNATSSHHIISQVAFDHSNTTVTFSATPTFNAATADIFEITLTGNVTSSTVSNILSGEIITFTICQDATGSHTFAWPSGFRGQGVIGATASTCSTQRFWYDGTSFFATSGMVTGE